MKNLQGIIAVAAVVLHLVSPCVQAEDVASDKESLRGIKLIGVTVGKISHTAEKIGIHRDSLRESVALQLRTEGISVATPDELHADSALPYLQVIFISQLHQINLYVYRNAWSQREGPFSKRPHNSLLCHALVADHQR